MKILFLTDTDLKGSGFLNVSMPLCTGLQEKGHKVIVAGLNYTGEQHDFPFTIIPIANFMDFYAVFQNLYAAWGFDVLMVAMDIPVQLQIMAHIRQYKGGTYKYVGIMPVEADPLCFSWSASLMEMAGVFVISKFGVEECKKMGVNAQYFQVGVKPELWPLVTEEAKQANRKLLTIPEKDFVMITVADNQERKNLSAGMEAFAKVHDKYPDSRYIVVTRENNYVGWRLRDYALELGISKAFMIIERGITQQELWSVMSVADVFVLPSKAEGLGLPLLDAMTMGIPCIATNACGMKELLDDGRGILIDPMFIHRDPFGNGRRYWIDTNRLTDVLMGFADGWYTNTLPEMKRKAHDFAVSRKWGDVVDTMDNYLKGLENVTK